MGGNPLCTLPRPSGPLRCRTVREGYSKLDILRFCDQVFVHADVQHTVNTDLLQSAIAGPNSAHVGHLNTYHLHTIWHYTHSDCATKRFELIC